MADKESISSFLWQSNLYLGSGRHNKKCTLGQIRQQSQPESCLHICSLHQQHGDHHTERQQLLPINHHRSPVSSIQGLGSENIASIASETLKINGALRQFKQVETKFAIFLGRIFIACLIRGLFFSPFSCLKKKKVDYNLAFELSILWILALVDIS